jgi:hypothetical protein
MPIKRIDRTDLKLCCFCGNLYLLEHESIKRCPDCDFMSLVSININFNEYQRKKIDLEKEISKKD